MWSRGLFWFVLVAWLTSNVATARAYPRSGELVISIDLTTSLFPSIICIKPTTVDPNRFETVEKLEDLKPGVTARIQHWEPACLNTKRACDRCRPPLMQTGAMVCWRAPPEEEEDRSASPTPELGPHDTRALHLQLDNVHLQSLRVAGADVVMNVLLDDAPPRVSVLGGGYHWDRARVVPSTSTLALAPRPRCLTKSLSFSSEPQSPPGATSQLTSSTAGRSLTQDYDIGQPVLVMVPQDGASTSLTLKVGTTTYEGTFSDPSAASIELSVKEFQFTWRKSDLIVRRRDAAEPRPDSCSIPAPNPDTECPRATLVATGESCALIPKESDLSQCVYGCKLRHARNLPTPLRLELPPPESSSERDLIVWEDELRFPNAQLRSVPPADQRRVYLVWSCAAHELIRGSETEGLQLTGPDGKTHSLSAQVSSLPITGLRSPAMFRYRYVGRSPFRSGTVAAHGDLLVIPHPRHTRQDVVLGVQVHAGYLLRPFFDNRRGNPIADLTLVGLVFPNWEITLSGSLTEHPAVLKVEGEPDHWTSSPQFRLTLGIGYRLRFARDWYVAIGAGPGITTRAFESDWAKSRLTYVNMLRARLAYEVDRSLSGDIALTAWVPERYLVNRQDSAGPLEPRMERTLLSLSLALGMQWSDAL